MVFIGVGFFGGKVGCGVGRRGGHWRERAGEGGSRLMRMAFREG